MQTDTLTWRAHALVEKWDADQTRWARRRSGLIAPSGDQLAKLLDPSETAEWAGNILVNNGINRLLNLLIGTGSIAAYTNSTARIGAGNSNTAAAASQTDLQASAGSSNRWFQAMDATYPQVSAQTATFKATFASGDGNFAWEEWGVDGGGSSSNTVGTNGSSTAALLNRRVASLGTKASGATWAFTVTITIS